jgi:hypothetical protein
MIIQKVLSLLHSVEKLLIRVGQRCYFGFTLTTVSKAQVKNKHSSFGTISSGGTYEKDIIDVDTFNDDCFGQ